MEPVIEKWPHAHGIEYVWVHGDKILGSVALSGDKPGDGRTRKKWAAVVGGVTRGVFTGKNGRLAAMRAVQHFSKHLWCVDVQKQLVASSERSA